MTDYMVPVTPLIIKETRINDILRFLQQGGKEYFNANVLGFEILRFEQRPVSNLFKVKVFLDSNSKNIFIKMNKLRNNISIDKLQQEIVKGYEIGKMLCDHFRKTDKYSAVRPVAYFLEYYTIVTEECIGDTLSSMIVKHGKLYPGKQTFGYLKDVCYDCGGLLRNIHNITQQDGLFDLYELIEYIDIRLKKLVAEGRIIFNENMRQKILNYLRKQVLMVKNDDLMVAGLHGDFEPSNMFVEGQKVKVMDYADFPCGSIYQDITYFYQRLENFMHKPIFRPKIIHALQDAFCQGYGPEADLHKPIFMMFRIRHVINNLRSILIGKTVPQGKKLAFYQKIFNEMICKRYLKWLSEVCETQ